MLQVVEALTHHTEAGCPPFLGTGPWRNLEAQDEAKSNTVAYRI